MKTATASPVRSTVRKTGLFASAAAALAAIGVPLAIAAPTAAPPSDSQGYVDSTARCSSPDTAVIFGTTDTSRVAICQTADGEYIYRGVRVRDGAKLVTEATKTAGETFVAKNEGATYTVTPQALSVTVNGDTFRTESWTDYHGPDAPANSTESTSTTTPTSTSTSATPSTSGSAAPSATTSATASATASSSASSSAPKTSASQSSSTVPLPPLPAEVGGATSSDG